MINSSNCGRPATLKARQLRVKAWPSTTIQTTRQAAKNRIQILIGHCLQFTYKKLFLKINTCAASMVKSAVVLY